MNTHEVELYIIDIKSITIENGYIIIKTIVYTYHCLSISIDPDTSKILIEVIIQFANSLYEP